MSRKIQQSFLNIDVTVSGPAALYGLNPVTPFRFKKIVTCLCLGIVLLRPTFGLQAEDEKPAFQITTDSSTEKYNRSIYMDI